jgi:hypothetical protein
VKSILDLTIEVRDPRRLDEPEKIDRQRKLEPTQLVVSGTHKATAKPAGHR